MDEKNNRKSKLHGYLIAGVVSAVLSVGIYAGVQYLYQKTLVDSPTVNILDNPVKAEVKEGPTVSDLKKSESAFSAVAEKVSPAVVKIKAKKEIKAAAKRRFPGRPPQPQEEDENNPFNDPFFDFFFGRPFPQQPETPQESLGSGFIIDKKGHVVTNNHVVAEADKIVVSVIENGDANKETEYKATILGTDPKTDLAVLKLEGVKDLPIAEWADSDKVKVGAWAIAIGSPFALTHTVTAGIVSAKGRSSKVIGADYSELIQTDAAINPGNSGGPLCNIEGEVMGVNTAIFTRSGGYMGIGFAIPSNVAKEIVNKLITDGKIIRGWLGVFIQPIDKELEKELGIKSGALVHEVMKDSPAAKSGLKAGDVIVEVDGKIVKDVTDLQRMIANIKPGQNIRMKVVSFGSKKPKDVNVKIGELPQEGKAEKKLSKKGTDQKPDQLGLVVAPSKDNQGVEVVYVDGSSIFKQYTDLEPGDVILSLNGIEIHNEADYKKAANKVKGSKYVSILVQRGDTSRMYRFALP